MEPILMGVAVTALTQGVTFLYEQAGEFLTSWRARRRDGTAPSPQALPPPADVVVGTSDPLPDPPDEATRELLQELKDNVELIKDGKVDADDPAAREAIADLRDVLEVLLRGTITLAGEAPRTTVADVEVVTKRVEGRVTGVRARLAERIERVRVETDDVASGGEVFGVDLG
jgi:hypothetical protein